MKRNSIRLVGMIDMRVQHNKSRDIIDNRLHGWHIKYNYEYHDYGNIWICWDQLVGVVRYFDKSLKYINMEIKLMNVRSFIVTTMYGSTNARLRSELWEY